MSNQNKLMIKENKLWGNTRNIFTGPFSETHLIEVDRGGYCSVHRHKDKWNRFFLISGKLKIFIYDNDKENILTILPGGFLDVPPGFFHKFEAEEKSICIESYWKDLIDRYDIERKIVGGKCIK